MTDPHDAIARMRDDQATSPVAGRPGGDPSGDAEANTFMTDPNPVVVDETTAELAALVAEKPIAAVAVDNVAHAAAVQPVVVEPVGVPAEPPARPAPPAPPARRRRTALRFGVSFIVGVALAAGVGAGALYAWSHQYDGRIMPGVHAGPVDLSGMTPDDAKSAIAAAWANLGDGQIVLAGPAGETVITYGDMGRRADVDTMLAEALATGRQGPPIADLLGGPQLAWNGADVAGEVIWDHARLSTAIAAAAAKIDKPAVDASVVVAADGSYRVTPSATGAAMDKAAVLASLEGQLGRLDAPSAITVQVPVGVIEPALTTADAAQAKATGDRMAWDLTLAYKSEQWKLPGANIRSAISFATAGGVLAPVVDVAVLDPALADVAKAVNRKPVDARLTLVGRTVLVEKPSVDGLTVNLEGTRSAVLDALAARQAGQDVPAVQIAVNVVQPALTSSAASTAAAGMVEISRWTTWFHIYIRNGFGANIWVPSTLLNGLVVPAGGKFDFIKAVGPITLERGFKPGNAIIQGKIDPLGAIGGGICTTSTTMFNAALLGGFKIVTRANHYYFISRYPTGLDATVYGSGAGALTMSWVNDTPNPVLVRAINTRKGSIGYVTFVLYSVPNGRKVVIDKPVIKNLLKGYAVTKYVSTLPKGVKRVDSEPSDGMNVYRTVHIYQDGKLLREYTFYSHYTRMIGYTYIGTGGGPGPTPTPGPGPTPTPGPGPTPTPGPTPIPPPGP
jgi:vancomycin resistance protein YoaR